MLRTFIEIMALILTLESAIFLTKGNLSLTPDVVAELATTKFDYNENIIGVLSGQCADTWVGVVLLLSAFTLQLVDLIWTKK